MEKFYIAEILLLPERASGSEKEAEVLLATQELIRQYLLERAQNDPTLKKLDWRWYNSELSSFKIDLAREIIKEAQFANLEQAKTRVLVLLNFDTAGSAAQNALLKLIEEPPLQTLILLPINNVSNILPTISSRCQLIDLSNQPKEQAGETIQVVWPDNLATALKLTEEYKDRTNAKKLIRQFLLNENLSVRQRQALLQANSDLDKNLNVTLALDHCFLGDIKAVE